MDTIRELLEAGADIEARTAAPEDRTPLWFTAASDKADAVAALVGAGEQRGLTHGLLCIMPFGPAAAACWVGCVASKNGLWLQLKTPTLCIFGSLRTNSCFLPLAAAGAQVGAACGSHRRTALHAAAGEGAVGAIMALLAAGADPRARDVGGAEPLHSAAARGQMDAAKRAAPA